MLLTLSVAAGAVYHKLAGTISGQNIIYNSGNGNLTLTGAGTGQIDDVLGTQLSYGTWGSSAGSGSLARCREADDPQFGGW